MKHIDLFSGIGGFALAAKWTGYETIVFCEKNEWCQKVLRKHWPDTPIISDIKDLIWLLDENDGNDIVETCEMISNEQQILETSNMLLKQQGNRKLSENAKDAGKKLRYVHPRQKKDKASSVQINVDTSLSGVRMEQTPEAGHGCEGNQIQTGNMVKGMKDASDIEKIRLHNGGEGFLQGIITHAKIADYIQKKQGNLMHTTLNRGEIFQNSDLSSVTESPYAKNVTQKNTGRIDLLTAGIPCQPASCAGKRRGTSDDRWLWPQTFRVIREVKPTWCILENVRGLLTLESGVVFDDLLSEMESIGYETQAFIIPACAVDAPHRRDRVWIVAHNGLRKPMELSGSKSKRGNGIGDSGKDVAHSEISKHKRSGNTRSRGDGLADFCEWQPESEWFAESRMGRLAHGIPNRVDRLRGLGNAIVPAVATELMRFILTVETQCVTVKS